MLVQRLFLLMLSSVLSSLAAGSRFTRRVRNLADRLLKTLLPSVRPYTWNNSRTDKLIWVWFDIGEFYEKLSSILNVYLDPAILTTALHENTNILSSLSAERVWACQTRGPRRCFMGPTHSSNCTRCASPNVPILIRFKFQMHVTYVPRSSVFQLSKEELCFNEIYIYVCLWDNRGMKNIS
jgi:hypothetical protein